MEACLPGICGSFLLLAGIFEGVMSESRYHATLIVTNTPFAKSYTGGLDLFFSEAGFFHCCLLISLLFIYFFIIYLFIFGGRGG